MYGYTHDFCNQKVGENQLDFSCIAPNYFGFDFYFMFKGIRLSCWETKEINIGGRNLTNINFASMKIVGTMKYFQVILA